MLKDARDKAAKEAQTKGEKEARDKADKDPRAKAEKEAKEMAEKEASAKAEKAARDKAERDPRAKAEEEAKEKAKKEAQQPDAGQLIRDPGTGEEVPTARLDLEMLRLRLREVAAAMSLLEQGQRELLERMRGDVFGGYK